MSNSAPILVCDDDYDDIDFFKIALGKIQQKREVITFENTIEAYKYLRTSDTKPFIILCDINLPLQNGLEFKKEIDADPEIRKKNIPFIFYSTSGNRQMVERAYSESVIQGYFVKPLEIKDVSEILSVIINYWEICWIPPVH